MNRARAVCRFGKWFAVAGVGRLGSFIRPRQFHGIGYPIKLSSEVLHALETGRPVVALESTIITHGMPYPQNVETAERVEGVVRSKGAVPATIGILRGEIHVGLESKQLCELALKEVPCIKTSRRDFPYVLSKKLNGGTTVSGTMLVASKAGIPIFVTGGIGGVHRGGEVSFDVSADLTELGRTPVAVISSGVKSILDIEKTLEYLETQGVCVATFGANRDFPAFFTSRSGFQSPYNVADACQAAHLVHHTTMWNSGSGVLIAVPIPERFEADGQLIEEAIRTALLRATELNIKGKEVTPYILSEVNRLTAGASLVSNMALIENNASVGAEIAVQLAKLKGNETVSSYEPHVPKSREPAVKTVVVGGSIVDYVIRVEQDSIQMDSSTHRGSIRQSYGGVGRNLADALTRLATKPLFLTAIGMDSFGHSLIQHNPLIETRGFLRLEEASTATYAAILDRNGDYQFGVGDMAIHDRLSVDWVRKYENDIASCGLLVMDGNTPLSTMEYVLEICRCARVPVWYEPTDVNKACKVFRAADWSSLAYTSPNLAELQRMVADMGPYMDKNHISLDQNVSDMQEAITRACTPLLEKINCVLVTLGKLGLMIVRQGAVDDRFPLAPWSIGDCNNNLSCTYYPPPHVDNIVSVSGAGDCLAAGFITGILKGWHQNECADLALRAAKLSLQETPAVPNALSCLIKANIIK